MPKQVHYSLSPVHFPLALLETYVQWIPPTFPLVYQFLHKSAHESNIPTIKAEWATIYSLMTAHVTDAKWNAYLLPLIPASDRFRFALPTTLTPEQTAYRHSLVEFATHLASETFVYRPLPGEGDAHYISSLWAHFSIQNDTECIASIESKLLSMVATLQWKYHSFFDTSVFYLFFRKRHESIVHPDLLAILEFYAMV